MSLKELEMLKATLCQSGQIKAKMLPLKGDIIF